MCERFLYGAGAWPFKEILFLGCWASGDPDLGFKPMFACGAAVIAAVLLVFAFVGRFLFPGLAEWMDRPEPQCPTCHQLLRTQQAKAAVTAAKPHD